MMNFELYDKALPGSAILLKNGERIDGEEFLNKVFFITDGIMLSQIKEISGVDGTTLQNWVKRGWIGNTVNKKYSKNQLARILIINMLRETMRLERIDFLLKYINGTINDEADDMIPESRLYGYICRVSEKMNECQHLSEERLNELVLETVNDFNEKQQGDKDRLVKALAVIVTAYYASLAKANSSRLFDMLTGESR